MTSGKNDVKIEKLIDDIQSLEIKSPLFSSFDSKGVAKKILECIPLIYLTFSF